MVNTPVVRCKCCNSKGATIRYSGEGEGGRKNFEINNFGLENSEKNNLLLSLREKNNFVFKIVTKIIAPIPSLEPPLRPKFAMETTKNTASFWGPAAPRPLLTFFVNLGWRTFWIRQGAAWLKINIFSGLGSPNVDCIILPPSLK